MEIITINVGHNDSEARVRSFIGKNGIKYPVIFDNKSTITKEYGITGVPTVIISDTIGTILFRQHYVPQPEEIDRLLR